MIDIRIDKETGLVHLCRNCGEDDEQNFTIYEDELEELVRELKKEVEGGGE